MDVENFSLKSAGSKPDAYILLCDSKGKEFFYLKCGFLYTQKNMVLANISLMHYPPEKKKNPFWIHAVVPFGWSVFCAVSDNKAEKKSSVFQSPP